ncbi:MAG TPA: hypothetical protein VJ833_09980 [Rhodanobacteraceae bacterium]|nr:hypothetical protein [Rhodanobacteraceae bacterium]
MYSFEAIKYAADNATGCNWKTFLDDMDEYEAAHQQETPGVFVQMGIAGEPQFPSVGSRSDELEALTRPVAKWLADKWNPHATVVITSGRAEVVCGELAVLHDA